MVKTVCFDTVVQVLIVKKIETPTGSGQVREQRIRYQRRRETKEVESRQLKVEGFRRRRRISARPDPVGGCGALRYVYTSTDQVMGILRNRPRRMRSKNVKLSVVSGTGADGEG